MYLVEFDHEAVKDLEKLDSQTAKRVLNKIKWLSRNFDFAKPESLHGSFVSLLKLRVGDYRVVYTSNKSSKIIRIHMIGHRSQIYNI